MEVVVGVRKVLKMAYMARTTQIVTRAFCKSDFRAIEKFKGRARVWCALRESLDGDEDLSSLVLDRTLIFFFFFFLRLFQVFGVRR